MKVLLMTRYGMLGASSRLRSFQYLPYLQGKGVQVDVSPLLGDKYLEFLYQTEKTEYCSLLKTYIARASKLVFAKNYQCLWFEKELFPWVPLWLENILHDRGIPHVVDYDDALFHRYDLHHLWVIRTLLGRKIDGLMKDATIVIAGNEYLANRAREAGALRIELIPTAVNMTRYPVSQAKDQDIFTIGWIGSPSTAKHLLVAESALKEFCANREAKVVLVGARENPFSSLKTTIRDWDGEREAEEIGNFDVGIMPLPDNPWERGKCGFKLIQYMACGKPIVASPVGVNREIVVDGENGFLASTHEEWVCALERLKSDPELCKTMGANGRRMVEEKYCLQVTAPRLHRILLEAAGRA